MWKQQAKLKQNVFKKKKGRTTTKKSFHVILRSDKGMARA